MKILYVITRSELGGAQAVVLTYLQALRTHANLALATGEEGFLADEARAVGVPVFVLPDLVAPIAPRLDCRALRALYKLIREYQPDLVHAHSSKAGLLARLAARMAGVPSVYTAHGFAFTGNARLLRKAIAIPSEWLGARLGDSLIAVSAYDGALGARYRILARNQVNVVHNGLPDVSFRARPAEGAPVNIIMVARFAPPKDHAFVLRSLAGMHCDFKLWFVGEGPTAPQVRAEAVRLGLGDRVVFLGARSDVPELLSKAHIFVLASDYEGLPISILEAMRTGLPVVASEVGGVPECVHQDHTGFLVPRSDVNTLRKSLRRLIASPILRERMGQAGRKLFQEQFTAARMIRETLSIYEAVLASSPQQAGIGISTSRIRQKIATTRTSRSPERLSMLKP